LKKLLMSLAAAVVALALAGVGFYRALEGPDPLRAAARSDTVFDDVVLVEPGVGRVEHRRLVLEGSRIATIDEARGKDVRWSGAFVLPGLVDAHAHFPPPYMPGQLELWAFLFLEHGVTGVRAMGDVGDGSSNRVRATLETGAFAAPRVATCGRWVDGAPPLWANSELVRTPEEARRAVDRLAEEGFDCVKVYNQLDAPSLAAVRETARSHDLPVVGHVPFRIRHEDAHLDDTQHLIGFFPADGPPRFPYHLRNWLSVPDSRVESIIRAVLADGSAMTPTLVVVDRMSRGAELLADPEDAIHRLLPPWYGRALWDGETGMNPAHAMTREDYEATRAAFSNMKRTLRRLHEAGIHLRTGTDTLAPLTVPGDSLRGELGLYVDAGLSPEEALAVATRSGAGIFDVPGMGTLRVGAPADFVLYREDPTRDLAALDTLLAVVQDGRVYTREMLDAQRARYREAFDGFFQQQIATPAIRALLGVALKQAAGINESPGDGAGPGSQPADTGAEQRGS
jgi:imidazolonepropionase-like amidohydrolase